MKVLLLTQVLPYPPDSGGKIKMWNVIKYLSRQHDVTLVSFIRGDQAEDVKQLEKYCNAVHTVPIERGALRDAWFMGRSLLTGQPFLMVRDDRQAMRRLVDRLAAETQFDIAHADQLNMAQYAARVPGVRKILDDQNAVWLLYKRLAQTMKAGPKKRLLERDWRLLKTYEGEICRNFEAVLAVSAEDKAALEEAAEQALDVTVIPIAVDTDEVTPVTPAPNANRILHIGTMYWPPNIDGILWFIKEIYPLIRAQYPDTGFDVVGAQPPQEIIDYSDNGTGINVTGYVENPTPYLEAARLMVVPLRAGGGMRVKILNALAQGIPMVSTTLGCEGIAVTHAENILIADGPQDFAQAVLQLLNNRDYARQLGQNGRKLICQTYDYRNICTLLDNVYKPQ